MGMYLSHDYEKLTSGMSLLIRNTTNKTLPDRIYYCRGCVVINKHEALDLYRDLKKMEDVFFTLFSPLFFENKAGYPANCNRTTKQMLQEDFKYLCKWLLIGIEGKHDLYIA